MGTCTPFATTPRARMIGAGVVAFAGRLLLGTVLATGGYLLFVALGIAEMSAVN